MRRSRGHPWWFMLAIGTCVTAVVHGDVLVAVLMLVAAWWLVVAR